MGKMHAEGVTLIEALVTLAMVGLVLAIGVPAVRDLAASSNMSVAANDLLTSLHAARVESVKRAAPVILCASGSWASPDATCGDGDLADGWIVFADDNPSNDLRDPAETIVLNHGPLHAGIVLTAPSSIEFSDLGRPSVAASFLLCDFRGDRTAGGVTAGRRVTLTATGRPQVLSQPGQVDCSG
ncbi:MAG: GspH/FimT family pseudopilin [Gammaproteobacteria bacterium]